MSPRLAIALGLATLCFLAQATHAATHPLAAESLRLKDPGGPSARAFKFRARLPAGTVVPDPRQTGAALEISGNGAGDGSSGVIFLPGAGWTALGSPAGSRGYRFDDAGVSSGVRIVDLRYGTRGGRLLIAGGGSHWPFDVGQPQQGIAVQLTIRGEIWCSDLADSSLRRNEPGVVIGRSAPAPASCHLAVCGDGTAGGHEECDDGNTAGGDGCSPACQLENATAVCRGVPTNAGTGIGSVLVAGGLNQPTHLTAPRLDPRRLFVVEQAGVIRVIRDGALLPTPFLDIQSKIQCTPTCGERGLLSLAFHPDYESNGRFFVDYTDTAGNSVVARYQVSDDLDRADETSEVPLLHVNQPFANHNGGQLAFAPDGTLYVGFGDGGSQNDPQENGQSDTTLLGKILRLDVDVDTPPFHAVPPSNPDANRGDPLGLIWAKGLRNPWRFAFDRANGDLYIGDVGQGAREEVDYQRASSPGGENYGWNAFEGTLCSDPSPHFASCAAALPFVVPPIYEYSHSDPGGPCSITGGFVYRGCRLPDLAGTYFFADYCSDRIETLRAVDGVVTEHRDRTADLDPPGAAVIDSITSFGEDARGELYLLDRGGEVYRIVPP